MLGVLAILSGCTPAHPGEAALLFGWDPVMGLYNPARAGCSVDVLVRHSTIYGESEYLESYAWDEGGFRQDATWEGGCRTRFEQAYAICDGDGFVVEQGPIRRSGELGNPSFTWKNTVRAGLLVRRKGVSKDGTELRQDLSWEDGVLVAVEQTQSGSGEEPMVLAITRREDGLPLSFSGSVGMDQVPAWSEGAYTYDAAGRLTERAFEGGITGESYAYEGDELLPTSGYHYYVGSSEADSSSEERTYTWSCPPA